MLDVVSAATTHLSQPKAGIGRMCTGNGGNVPVKLFMDTNSDFLSFSQVMSVILLLIFFSFLKT